MFSKFTFKGEGGSAQKDHQGGAVFNLFLENVAKWLHPWSRSGKRCHLRGWSRFFSKHDY